MDSIVRRRIAAGLLAVACVVSLVVWIGHARYVTSDDAAVSVDPLKGSLTAAKDSAQSADERTSTTADSPNAGITTAGVPPVQKPAPAGFTIRGRVYDETSGVGVANATLSLRDSDADRFGKNWRSRPTTRSAKDGSFAFSGVPAGPITLQITAEDYAQEEYELIASADAEPVQIALWTGGTIAGRITDSDGVTPRAASISLINLTDTVSTTHGTPESGEFSFKHLASGQYRVIGQTLEGLAEREVSLAKNERVEDIVLALAGGHRITGVVTVPRPEELRQVRIRIRRDNSVGLPYGDVTVEPDGAYTYRGVPAGRVVVVAEIAMRRQLSKTLDMPANADATVNFDFPAGTRLTGRVTRGGAPLPGVQVVPRPAIAQTEFHYNVQTSGDGTYTFEDLAEGDYTLRLAGYVTRPIRVHGNTEFDIDVPPGGLLGRVIDESTGTALANATLQLLPTESSGSGTRLRSTSDATGRFTLAPLENGDFLIVVYKPGYALARKQISYSGTVFEMTIPLPSEPGVEVRVRDADDGRALREVLALETGSLALGSTIHLPLGSDGVGYLPAGLAGHELVFSALGYTPVNVRPWDGRPLDLQMTRNGR